MLLDIGYTSHWFHMKSYLETVGIGYISYGFQMQEFVASAIRMTIKHFRNKHEPVVIIRYEQRNNREDKHILRQTLSDFGRVLDIIQNVPFYSITFPSTP